MGIVLYGGVHDFPTLLTEHQLAALRAQVQRHRTRFTDPLAIAALDRILAVRGQRWAAAVLGRDIRTRALAFPRRPYFRVGEEFVLVAADAAETRAQEAAAAPAKRKGKR